MNRAMRFNKGKVRMELVPPDVIEGLAQVYTKGAEKYEANNWMKGAPWQEGVGSLMRHLTTWRQGISNDSETGLNHLLHVAWNALTLYYYERHGLGEDDRPLEQDKLLSEIKATLSQISLENGYPPTTEDWRQVERNEILSKRNM